MVCLISQAEPPGVGRGALARKKGVMSGREAEWNNDHSPTQRAQKHTVPFKGFVDWRMGV